MSDVLDVELIIRDCEGYLFQVNGDNFCSYDYLFKWFCTCEDYYFRRHFCKHMKACADFAGIKDVTVYQEVLS